MTTLPMYHAHWDCSRGATTTAMLAACFDAAGDGAKGKLEDDLKGRFNDFLADVGSSNAGVEVDWVQSKLGKAVVVKPSNQTQGRNSVGYEALGKLVSSTTVPNICGIHVKRLPDILATLQDAELAVNDYSGSFQLDASTVIEIISILLLLDYLNIKTVSCSSLPMGEGYVESDDGDILPVPSPATLRLLLGMRTCPGPSGIVTGEMVTSSACAILRRLVMLKNEIGNDIHDEQQSIMPPIFVPQMIGLGANSKAGDGIVRLIIGHSESITASESARPAPPVENLPWKLNTLNHLEANLDDTTAEALAFAIEILLKSGALDAWVTPIVMKKGRAAHTLHCLCSSDDTVTDKLLTTMFRQTTTLGIRIHRNMDRAALRREFVSVQTPFLDEERRGIVDVKVGYLGDKKEIVSVKPEFDHCKTISLATNVPLKRISDTAIQKFYSSIEEE